MPLSATMMFLRLSLHLVMLFSSYQCYCVYTIMPWSLISGRQFSPRCHPRHNDTNCFWIGKGFRPLLGRKTGPAIPANRHDFGKRLRSYVLTGLYSEAPSGMSTPQLFSTLLTFVCFGFTAIIYCLPAYYMPA